MSDTCIKGMKFLNHIEEQSSHYQEDYCKYLYYWIYCDERNKNKSADRAREFYHKLFVGYLEDVHVCNNHINKVKKVIPEKVWKLIELYKKFNNISPSATDNDSKCDCVNSCAILYKNEVKLCFENYDYDFCYELENSKTIYAQTVTNLNYTNGAPKHFHQQYKTI